MSKELFQGGLGANWPCGNNEAPQCIAPTMRDADLLSYSTDSISRGLFSLSKKVQAPATSFAYGEKTVSVLSIGIAP